jgi:hypothetical protein
MLINSFFKLKLYHLNLGWIELSKSVNRILYLCWKKTKLIFLNRNIPNLKKTLILLQNVIKSNGVIFLTTSYFYYFKSVFNFSFSIKEFVLKSYREGFLSNYLSSKNFKAVPDLILIFNSQNNLNLFKEIKYLGVPSIGVSSSLLSYHYFEYFIFLANNNYFINFLVFKIYLYHLRVIKR